jgi:penicillin amidase
MLARHKGYPGIPALMEQWAYLSASFLKELTEVDCKLLQVWIPRCMEQADHLAQHWQMWGNLHKVRLRHVLGYSRILGKLFSSRSFPAAGSRETLMKNAHGLIRGFDETSYGSQSRHLSDMSDLDSNFFVLLGGQDGWVGSQMMQDQIPLWRSRQSIQMPLRDDTIERLFMHQVTHSGMHQYGSSSGIEIAKNGVLKDQKARSSTQDDLNSGGRS